MIKRVVASILFIISSLGAEFLEPQDAFKTSVKFDNNATIILTLGQDIYAYDDKLKVMIDKNDITKELVWAKPEFHHDTYVHFKEVKIVIPSSTLKKYIDAKKIVFYFQGCSELGICYQPMDVEFTMPTIKHKTIEKIELNESDSISQTLASGNIILILATFFGFGLLLSLTPCIFPMIPILSSIIVSASKSEGGMSASRGFFLSLVYVLSMSIAYTFAGVIAGLFGANLQVALQNPYVLIAFSGVFVALALSMFGYFSIELPQSLQNRINKTTEGREKQGILGVAIMGFFSALIVGPCVAPPLAGALVYIGQSGDALLGGSALFVMSIGMGVPLLLIGLGAGKFMPKPSGWMNRVSQTFGVIMLGVAIWMLERIIPAEVTLVLWSILLIGSAVYMGLFEPIKDNVREEFKIFKVVAVLFFIYGSMLFVGGVNGATNPLKPLHNLFVPSITDSINLASTNSSLFKRVKNIQELDTAIKASKKPIILDFYADWCMSCKELEHNTFSDLRVREEFKNFTLLQADVTANSDEDKALLKRFNLFGPPGIIFWNTDKNEVRAARLIGYKNADEFLDHLKKFF